MNAPRTPRSRLNVVVAVAVLVSALQLPGDLMGDETSESRGATAEAIKPFRIAVEDEVLRDLQERLARTRWPDQIDGSRNCW